jgi:hypothetical protein
VPTSPQTIPTGFVRTGWEDTEGRGKWWEGPERRHKEVGKKKKKIAPNQKMSTRVLRAGEDITLLDPGTLLAVLRLKLKAWYLLANTRPLTAELQPQPSLVFQMKTILWFHRHTYVTLAVGLTVVVCTCTFFFLKKKGGRAPMAHTFNLSYSGGRDQEDHSLKPAWANSSVRS